MSKNKKIFYGVIALVSVLVAIGIWYVFFYKQIIIPIQPNPQANQLTAEQAIDLIAQQYPKVIQARGDSNIPDESIKQIDNGWQIEVLWGLCPECHCIFEVNKNGSIKVLDKGEKPSLCESATTTINSNQTNSQIAITTDKTEYDLSEEIKITSRNNSSTTIYLLNPFEQIEKFENGKWQEIAPVSQCPCGWLCEKKIYEILEPAKEKVVNWDQNYVKGRSDRYKNCKKIQAESGKYQIYLDYSFKDPTREHLLPIDITRLYSNEFEIKQ